MTKRYCARCDDELNTPIDGNAYYVLADDFIQPEEITVTYAYFHTDESRERVQELVAKERYNGLTESTITSHAVMLEDGHEDGLDTELIIVETVDDINTVSHDPDFITFKHETVLVPVQRTGLVCLDCHEHDDQDIWGPK